MSACCECCVLSSTVICNKLITRPKESYRLWCVVVCDLETSWMRGSWPTGGCCAKNYIYIYMKSEGKADRVQAMKAYRGIQVQLHSILTSALHAGEWSASSPGFLTLPYGITQYNTACFLRLIDTFDRDDVFQNMGRVTLLPPCIMYVDSSSWETVVWVYE